MLRRLNVRTRLIAVIAVPLVLLFAVAAPEVMQRRDEAAAADRAAALADDVQQVISVVDSLQTERTLSAAQRAGAGDQLASELADQREATDAALDEAVPVFERLEADQEISDVVSTAVRARRGLDLVRTEVDTAESISPWIDPFTPLLSALLDVQDSLGTSTADVGVGGDLAQLALISRTKEATANQAAQLAASYAWGELRGDQVGLLQEDRGDERAFRTAYLAASPTDLRNERRDELNAGAGATVGRTVDTVIASGELGAGSLITWLEDSAQRQALLRQVEIARAEEVVQVADALGADARRASTGYLLLAGLGLLLALGLALMAARSITRPLRELASAADHLAEERLPQLVEALRNPVDDDHELPVALEQIKVRSDDELGQLAQAFNAVQAVAVDVAAEQASLLRKGISDLYVNLARRNQALIDRQIQMLDRLESNEQDPEILEHLYLLDHLATRMRRNAESLLILAGAESGPRRSKAIDMVDVVRAALSEVEEYERVDLGAMADGVLHGPAVSDVAHLVAELLENATHFSPPETVVRVDGTRTGGSYQLVISDHGVGIRTEQLEELNEILRDPPVTGLALGRSLGCLVAARLAARHGITVRLKAGARDGVDAYVVIPSHLLVDEGLDPRGAPAPDARRSLASSASQDSPALDPIRVDDRDAVSATLSDALPARAEFDAGLRALLDGSTPPPLVEPPVVDDPTHQVELELDVSPSAASLQRRVPGATAEAVPEPVEAPPSRRSPDEVRALLSRYRSGLQAGRVSDGPEEERS